MLKTAGIHANPGSVVLLDAAFEAASDRSESGLPQYRHGDSNPRLSRSSKPNSALGCGFSTALDRC